MFLKPLQMAFEQLKGFHFSNKFTCARKPILSGFPMIHEKFYAWLRRNNKSAKACRIFWDTHQGPSGQNLDNPYFLFFQNSWGSLLSSAFSRFFISIIGQDNFFGKFTSDGFTCSWSELPHGSNPVLSIPARWRDDIHESFHQVKLMFSSLQISAWP